MFVISMFVIEYNKYPLKKSNSNSKVIFLSRGIRGVAPFRSCVCSDHNEAIVYCLDL